MKQTIILISRECKNRAMAIIDALPISPIHEVTIKEKGEKRSLDSNSLYWKWLTVIGNELGESKEELAERYKDRYLVQIYERDNPEYSEMVEALREVYRQGMKVEAVALRSRIVALTSTTTATVRQMSEYMHSIEMSAAELGIRLPFPEDN